MSEKTGISWTDHTFNTHWGCSKISPGCDGCYAERLAARFSYGWGDDAPKREFGPEHWNELLLWDRKAAADGVRRRVFTNSMSDLFDKFAPAGVRERHFEFIKRTPNLDHLLLTKRIGNVARMLPADWGNGYPNVWLGITVVNQEEADRDIPKLLAVPARVRFLSIEPMLGPISLRVKCPPEFQPWLRSDRISWVIAGGESGSHARPSHPDWFRSLRDQCAAAGVAFHFKQWGEWREMDDSGLIGVRTVLDGDPEYESQAAKCDAFMTVDGELITSLDAAREGVRYRGLERPGKKAAGRLLDGVPHDAFPA